jgi:hypothetical protein
MTNDQIQAVRELVLKQIQFLEAVGVPTNHEQLKNLKGWIINHPIEEFDGDTLLEIAQ